MKECSKCHEFKELVDYPLDRTRPDGYGYMCKICKNKIKKEYRDRHRGEISDYNRDYYEKKKKD